MPQSDMPPVVALPIEVKNRELDGKLLLASYLATNGYKVAIGRIGQIKSGVDLINPDIFFAVDGFNTKSKENLFSMLNKNRVRIMLLDTEGGVFTSEEAYQKRLSNNILKYIDDYLAWGNKAANAFPKKEFPEVSIHITGNPRFDLLTKDHRDFYRPDVLKIAGKHGSYTLFCMNFTSVNPVDKNVKKNTIKRLGLETKKVNELKRETFSEYLNAIDMLADQGYNIIIRPHPSENHEYYIRRYNELENVTVCFEGDSVPWILASEAMVHCNSTTGIESILLNKPTCSYNPVDSGIEPNIAYDISPKVSSFNELKNFISNDTVGEIDYNTLNEYIATDVMSHDKITRCLLNSNVASGRISTDVGFKDKIKRNLRKHSLLPYVKKIFDHFVKNTEPTPKERYGMQKFTHLHSQEIDTKLQRLNNICDIADVDYEKIPELSDCYYIY